MKKIDLVHTTILIVAILAGYSAIEYIIYMLSSIAYWEELYYARDVSGKLVSYLIIALLFACSAVLLIKNGRKYAVRILKEDPEDEWDDAAQLQLDRQNIIFILLIGIGLYILVQALPYAISDMVNLFRDKIAVNPLKGPKSVKSAFVIEALRVTIGTCIIYAAPALTNFINRKIAVKLDSNS